MNSPSGSAAFARRSGPRPHSKNSLAEFGDIWTPAPISASCGADSYTVTECPFLASAMLAERPPTPAPTVTIFILKQEEVLLISEWEMGLMYEHISSVWVLVSSQLT